MVNNRIQQVNSLIKKELSNIILREVDFPKGFLTTITRVGTSPDLEEANVFIAVIPDDKIEQVLAILNKIIYFLQQKLNKRLKMRPIPRIRFKKEGRTREAARVEELLEEGK